MLAGNSESKSKNDGIFLMLIDQHMMINELLSLKSLISAVEAGGVRKKQVYVGTMEEEGGLVAMVMVEAGVSEAVVIVVVVVVVVLDIA